MTRPHPHLAVLRVASPCHESWEHMRGDEQKRFCPRCEKHVCNISVMSAGEAEALLARTRFGVCVRFSRRADGTVITGDCPVGKQQKRRALALSAASLVAAACVTTQGEPQLPPVDLRDAQIEAPSASATPPSVEADAAVTAPAPPSVVLLGEPTAIEQPAVARPKSKRLLPRPGANGQPGARKD